MNSDNKPKKFELLLTPVFSNYDVLESGILSLYTYKAFNTVDPAFDHYILNLMTDTPYLLYQLYGLYNPSRTLISSDSLGVQQTILIIALNAVILSHITNCQHVVINGNGPVVNEGFSTMMGICASLGKKVVYWKDDTRHLWGFNDNPMSIGNLPVVHSKLMEPSNFPIRLSYYDTQKEYNCGNQVLVDLIKEVNAVNITPGTPSSLIQNQVQLGNLLNASLNGQTWVTAIQADPKKVYESISSVIRDNTNLISKADATYISGKSRVKNIMTQSYLSGGNIFISDKQPPSVSSEAIKMLQKLASKQ